MSDISDLQNQIYNCNKCSFDRDTDARFCGGFGIDHRVLFVAESPSTAGGTGLFMPENNFVKTAADCLFYEARQKVGLQKCYLIDLVKCGIPNGKPTIQKLENCIHYLNEEIEFVKPKVIVVVGKSISFQDGIKRVSFNFSDFLRVRLGTLTPITWVYHYSWIYRYKRNDRETIQIFFTQFENILTFL